MRFQIAILFALIYCASAQYRFGDFFRSLSGNKRVAEVPQVQPIPSGVGSRLATILNGIIPMGFMENTIKAVGQLLDNVPSDIQQLPDRLANSGLTGPIRDQVMATGNSLGKILEIVQNLLSNNVISTAVDLVKELAAMVSTTIRNIIRFKLAEINMAKNMLPETFEGIWNMPTALLQDLNPLTAFSKLFSMITSGGLNMILDFLGMGQLNSLLNSLTGGIGDLNGIVNLIGNLGGNPGLSSLVQQLGNGQLGGLLGNAGALGGLLGNAGGLGGLLGNAGGLGGLLGGSAGAGAAGGLAGELLGGLAGNLAKGVLNGGAGGLGLAGQLANGANGGGNLGGTAGGMAGTALGTALGGPIGGIAGQKLGGAIGNAAAGQLAGRFNLG